MMDIDTSRFISDQDRGAFRKGYVEAMFWANAYDDTMDDVEDMAYLYHAPGNWWEGTPVDLEDANAFLEENIELLRATGQFDFSQHGHDFALTRNHHGAGFWDRGYSQEVGDALTEASHAYGEAQVYVGEDECECGDVQSSGMEFDV